jgi:hypothetical protein
MFSALACQRRPYANFGLRLNLYLLLSEVRNSQPLANGSRAFGEIVADDLYLLIRALLVFLSGLRLVNELGLVDRCLNCGLAIVGRVTHLDQSELQIDA